MLTVNALAVANRVIIPVQAEYLPAKGKSMFAYDPNGKIAEGYKNLTQEVKKLEKQREKSRVSLGR